MLKNTFIFLLAISFFACTEAKIEIELIVHNALIYTVDSTFSTKEAMAIDNGKIIETGTNEKILEKYTSKESLDAQGQTVLPGFIDAHCHFLSYGLGLGRVDLVGTKSFSEVIDRVVKSSQKENV